MKTVLSVSALALILTGCASTPSSKPAPDLPYAGPDDQSFLLILEDGIWRSYVEAGCGSLHKIRDKICAAVNSLREQDSDKSPPKISGVHELLASAAKSKE